VTVRTYWSWETTATLHLLGGTCGTGGAHGGGGAGHIVLPHAQLVKYEFLVAHSIFKTFCTYTY